MDSNSMEWLDSCWAPENGGWSEMVQGHREDFDRILPVVRDVVEHVTSTGSGCVVYCSDAKRFVAMSQLTEIFKSRGVFSDSEPHFIFVRSWKGVVNVYFAKNDPSYMKGVKVFRA